jgi:oxygen-independent coproporphyrinogen-3 oxidase
MCTFSLELELERYALEWQQLQELARDGLVKLSEHSGCGQATVTTEGRWLIRTIAAVLDPAQRQRASGSRLV